VQVTTPPTSSEFRGGITGFTLRPVSGADVVSLITDEHLLHEERKRPDQEGALWKNCSKKVEWKLYNLNQLCSLQHNACRFMIVKFRAGELQPFK